MKKFFQISKFTNNGKKIIRTGTIYTDHGNIETPAFIPVATKGTLKGLLPEIIKSFGAQALFANAYHLYLSPGSKIIKQIGGLHKFMNWNKPLFTDSGGFQILSMSTKKYKKFSTNIAQNLIYKKQYSKSLIHVKDKEVIFKSYIDGSIHKIGPEKSIEVQCDIGADIILTFDELNTFIESKYNQKQSLERTKLWAQRCLKKHQELINSQKYNKIKNAIFGIIQGGKEKDLREKAAKDIARMNVNGHKFDGYGIGGILDNNNLGKIIQWCVKYLPLNKPRHLLGIGDPLNLMQAIENGIDTFDCVSPARLARHACVYTDKGRINLNNSKYKNMIKPIDEFCLCYTCKYYSISYLCHLSKSKEMLFSILTTIHNEYYIINFIDKIRLSIKNDYFADLKLEFYGLLNFRKKNF